MRDIEYIKSRLDEIGVKPSDTLAEQIHLTTMEIARARQTNYRIVLQGMFSRMKNIVAGGIYPTVAADDLVILFYGPEEPSPESSGLMRMALTSTFTVAIIAALTWVLSTWNDGYYFG